MVLVCSDIDTGTAAYESLLGRPADWRARSDGAATAVFRVANTSLELMAPDGDGPVADRLREIITQQGPGLTSLAFESDDISGDHYLFTRRGLAPGEVTDGSSQNEADGATRRWKRFRCSDAMTAGVKTFVLQPETLLPAKDVSADAASELDHIVIETPNPDRALAQYGARLGLHLALDRTREEFRTRFLFFKTGGLIFEVVSRLGETPDPTGPDVFRGLTWKTEDLDAAHARLEAAGFNVSEVRRGRKTGTRVFTVRDGTLGVPTLFIGYTPR